MKCLKSKSTVHRINLLSLDQEFTEELITDILQAHDKTEEFHEMVNAVQKKTLGHPLFVKRFVEKIFQEKFENFNNI